MCKRHHRKLGLININLIIDVKKKSIHQAATSSLQVLLCRSTTKPQSEMSKETDNDEGYFENDNGLKIATKYWKPETDNPR